MMAAIADKPYDILNLGRNLMSNAKALQRVVITGSGCISPLGLGKEEFWQALREGQSGVGRISRFDASDLPVQIAAEVRGFNADLYIAPKDRQHVSPAVAYAIAAADVTFKDAGISPRDSAR